MTDLVHYYTIPIDFKLQIFPYTCLFIVFVTIIIFGELTSTFKQRMATDIIFAGATPIN